MCFLLNPIEFEVSLNETQVSEMGPVSKSLLRRELTCKEEVIFVSRRGADCDRFLEMKSIDFMICLDFKWMSLIFFFLKENLASSVTS